MATVRQRMGFWLPIAAVFLLGLTYAFWPRPVPVHMTEITEGPLQVSITDEGDTRIHDVYTLSAPISGQVRRIHHHAGDAVVAGETIVAEIEPSESAFLDPRTRAETLASKQAAESARHQAEEAVKQAQADFDFADSELARIRPLAASGTASQRELDDAVRQYKSGKARLANSQAALQMRNYEVKRQDALLAPPAAPDSPGRCGECMSIRSPITGTILRVLTRSEGVVQAGTPLLEIGDAKDLEVVVELLSSRAVMVEPGMPVRLQNWGGETPLWGRVDRVEPVGFTKYSALGIEEQRVNVIVSFTSPYEEWEKLGHGYQLDASVILWEADHVRKVPVTALFREAGNWHVFVVRNGKAVRQAVSIGRKNDNEAEVTDGLQAGDRVITYPNDTLTDGTAVSVSNAT
ncbi:efflux RND transporter periplasmic adaptor subunit [Alteromonas sp. CYL-A6]|uniref:efflux RND transporter periplasmic adaptor subunit n=1 Tax=Alteromonas nitratireducens TaxID=3390813 RepID=UPI0034B67854